jgi:hypothetical protein
MTVSGGSSGAMRSAPSATPSTSGTTEIGWALRKVSEHGLGHLLSPYGSSDVPTSGMRRWIREGWVWILDPSAGRPWWFELPAVSRTALSSPRLLHAFDGYNDSVQPDARIRPFNFCLSVHVAEFGHPEGVDPTRFHLVAPYEEDPANYLKLPWVDRFTGTAYRITVEDDFGASGAVLVKTYGDVFTGYIHHLEAKSLDPGGRPGRGSGVLNRRPIREGVRVYTGKESNRIEDVRMGFWHRLDDVLTEYGRARDPWYSWVVPALKLIPLRWLVEQTGLDRRTVQRLRNRQAEPRPSTEHALTAAAGSWARTELRSSDVSVPRDPALACRMWLEHREAGPMSTRRNNLAAAPDC